MEDFIEKQRLTRRQKEANDKAWFKAQIELIDSMAFNSMNSTSLGDNTGISRRRKMQINYDLFNNKINKSDFEHVCYPFGREVGELPADFTNKDIISGKIKALLGMEMRRPFAYTVVAVNKEATTRKEQEYFNRLKQYVTEAIMKPVREQAEIKAMEQAKNRELTPEEKAQTQKEIESQINSMTPVEVKKYMSREHQDPAEILAVQILEYLKQKLNIKDKFNNGFKNGTISDTEVYWVGSYNAEPVLICVNPMKFDCGGNNDTGMIQDCEWATYDTYLTPSQIVSRFGKDLTNSQIDKLYQDFKKGIGTSLDNFVFDNTVADTQVGIRVRHYEWKSLKPVKFLTYRDLETGEMLQDIVDEEYKLNLESGDISIETEWIPTKYEGYKIGVDTYVLLREVPGQNKDLNNLYECKLSYIGARYDSTNSDPVSLVDRMKYYQYLYNILFYKIELLIASDEGKSILLNASLIPKSAGLDVEKWLYYFKTAKIGLMNPNEEGNKGSQNIGEAAKEINMSLASDINTYIQLLEYIERRCGESVGITKAIEGQIGSNEAVRNTQQALLQSANILEPYFNLHNIIKRDVLQALIECAKSVYVQTQPEYLSYVLDDLSQQLVAVNTELLDNSSYGVFVSDSMKSEQALQMVQQLAHAAIQNQNVEISDIIKILRSDSVVEAEELLKVAELEKQEKLQQQQQAQLESQEKAEESARQFRREEWEFEMNKIKLQEELKTERELQKQVILSLGFNQDKDIDKDGVPDILEVYKAGIDTEIKQAKINLEKAKLEQQKIEHKDKIDLEKQKAKQNVIKNVVSVE